MTAKPIAHHGFSFYPVDKISRRIVHNEQKRTNANSTGCVPPSAYNAQSGSTFMKRLPDLLYSHHPRYRYHSNCRDESKTESKMKNGGNITFWPFRCPLDPSSFSSVGESSFPVDSPLPIFPKSCQSHCGMWVSAVRNQNWTTVSAETITAYNHPYLGYRYVSCHQPQSN